MSKESKFLFFLDVCFLLEVRRREYIVLASILTQHSESECLFSAEKNLFTRVKLIEDGIMGSSQTNLWHLKSKMFVKTKGIRMVLQLRLEICVRFLLWASCMTPGKSLGACFSAVHSDYSSHCQ